MKGTYRVTVKVDVTGDPTDTEDFKEAVKDAILIAVENDDDGAEELTFTVEDEEEDADCF